MTDAVLVTGGAGFIAGWCIVQLLQKGERVRATVRRLDRADAVRKAVASAGVDVSALEFAAADLTADAGWAEAMAGVDRVLHVASPLGTGATDNPDDLIVPARDGALRVLKAAVDVRVKRVVMTSSCAAANPGSMRDTKTDETVWTDPGFHTDAYRRSKAISEGAAWEFMRASGGATEFATILPSAVFGPVLSKEGLGSVGVIKRLIDGSMPAMPRVGMCVVDVRDVADAHLRALSTPAAAGERFIAAGEFLWMSEIADALRAGLGPRGDKIPTRTMPDAVFRAAALVRKELRALTPMLGRRTDYSWAKAERLLGYHPRPARETVLACAESLLAA